MNFPRRAGLTIQYTGRVRAIITDVDLNIPFDPTQYAGKPEPEWKHFKGIWDTGATNSVITTEVISALGLKQVGVVQVDTPSDTILAKRYLVNMRLPNKVRFSAIPVTEGKLKDANALIGMDIINHGDFAITNKNGATWMTFQIPSTQRIDFVAEIDRDKKAEQKLRDAASKQKIGRNASCPCGSGKKYKFCHGA